MHFSGSTHSGKIREDNQDVFMFRKVSDCLLAVLCDGVGGHIGGELAANTAINAFADKMEEKLNDLLEHAKESFFHRLPTYIEKFFNLAADYANMAVLSKAKQCGHVGMCTTLVCGLFAQSDLYVFNVGDSRLYQISPLVRLISKDQSWVQAMVDMGKLTENEAKNHPNKNIITSSVGNEKGVNGNYYSTSIPEKNARFMLCSDGLSDYMDVYDFDDLFSEYHPPEELCELLIERANSHGGKDNITVQIVEIA